MPGRFWSRAALASGRYAIFLLAMAFACHLTFAQEGVNEHDEFLRMAQEYADRIQKDNDDRIYKVTAFDGSYDIFEYGPFSGKAERILSYDPQGRLYETTVFYRDSESGQLLGYSKDAVMGFFSLLDRDNDVFLKGTAQNFNAYNTFFSSLVITSDNKALDFAYDDEGRLEIRMRDGRVAVYGRDGKIIRDGEARYSYDEKGDLASIEEWKDGSLVERTEYEDLKPKTQESFENGLIVRKIIFNESGNLEERYEGGRLYARIRYFDDNRRVREIEYVE